MRILLVEDDAMIGAAVDAALKDAAYAVDWARDGPMAALAAASEPYDLVLLDRVWCVASNGPVSVGLAGQMQGALRRAWRVPRSSGATPQMAGQGDARRERPTSASPALPCLPLAPPAPAQGALF